MKRRLLVGGAWIGSVVLAGTVGLWAAGETLTPLDDPLEPPEPVTYEVVLGEVGQSITLVGFAEWPSRTVALNQASGVVTSVPEARSVAIGNTLYLVDERPVVAGVGEVPAYRDLKVGDVGEDVRQLQSMMVTLGFADSEPDGTFRSATRTAVRSWQRAQGVTDDGTVRQGDIVWFPELPARVLLSDEIMVGAQLSGGEEILLVSDLPRVWVPVGRDQRNQIHESAAVRVAHSEGVWEGSIAEAVAKEASELGDFDLILGGVDGGPICGPDCVDLIPVEGRSEYRVEIVLIPAAEGPVVPASAVITRPDGSAYVTAPDGRQLSVSVVGSQGSMLLVDVLEIGTQILVFGDGE